MMKRSIVWLFALLVALAACGDSGGGIGNLPGSGDNVFTDPDTGNTIAVSDNDDSVVVETDDGTFSAGGNIPEGFPFDLPEDQVEGGFATSSGGQTSMTVSLVVPDGVGADVFATYKANLASQGVEWDPESDFTFTSEDGFIGSAAGTYQDKNVSISVADDPSGTIVIIGVGDV